MIREFEPYVPVIDVDVATFDDAIPDAALVKLNAAVTPLQDLHGYGSPWPAGGGKNKLPIPSNSQTINGVTWTVGPNGTLTASRTATNSNWSTLPLVTLTLPAGTYKVVCAVASNDVVISAREDNVSGQILTQTSSSGAVAMLVLSSETDVFISANFRPTYSGTNIAVNPMLLDGSETDTSFAPYANICPITGSTGANALVSPTLDAEDATVYPIDWEDDAGTVYGGSINFTTGELTVTHGRVDMGTLSWIRDVSGSFYANASTLGIKAGVRDISCEVLDFYPGNYVLSQYATYPDNIIGGNVNGGTNIYVKCTTYTTAADFKAAMSGNYLVYELATPITYELDPVEVKTLQDPGVNNVWVDTGKILELYYPIDISYFRRYFMVNSGYILLDGGDIDLTSTDPQLIEGSWDRIVTAMETGKPIWAFNTKYGTGKPLSPVPVFAWYLSATSIVIVGATLHIIVSNTNYCVVQDVASA